ncbi:MAG: extracellular solute-binding protein [Burkholderiaceae bacterium]
MNARAALLAALLTLGVSSAALAQGKTLRLLTWPDNVSTEVKAEFEKETGYTVEVTLSSNDDMIAKLRNTEGPAFDLAQPSLDRINGAQQEFGLYRPLDLDKIETQRFIPTVFAATRKNSTLNGKVYGVPHIWGTDGLVVNTNLANISDYPDLCRAEYKGKTEVRLRRSTLLAFAFASGRDPFALYNNPKAYRALMENVARTLLACKAKPRFWDNRERLLHSLRSGDTVGAIMWDAGGWSLNTDMPEIRYVAPRSGALGWVDTFALPARGGNDAAAYAWINFNLRPEIAAKVAASAGNFTASLGAEKLMDARRRAQFESSYPAAALARIHWYPAAPANLEDIEFEALERLKAPD